MRERLPARRGPSGLIIAAPTARSGKTTVTLGLLAALRARGVAVSAAKVGPDLVAPAWHAAVTGRPCYNLDGWAMGPALLDRIIRRAGEGTDLVLCDGTMGLFDGTGWEGAAGDGSTADVARHSGWPVVLVVDGRGLGQSAAALVQGFARHRRDVRIPGVVFNSVTDGRQQRLAVAAVTALGIAVLGALPEDPDIAITPPPPGDLPDATSAAAARRIETLGRLLAANVDLDRLLALAVPARGAPGAATAPLPPLGQRIAVAHDAAFGALYPHVLDGWRTAGAELVLFSPLADEAPPAYADAVYLPGGAPERHAPVLAGARRFHEGLHSLAQRGPVYGEGGGYAVLGDMLETSGGAYPMAGLLGVRTVAHREDPSAAGHRRVRLLADHPFAPAGTGFAAHGDAHLAVAAPGLDDALFAAIGPDGQDAVRCGSRRGPVSGSLLHLLA